MTPSSNRTNERSTSQYVTLQAISVRTGVTTRRVRYLERAGLIGPALSDAHFRLYHVDTIERVLTIERLTRDLGVNVAGVEVILHMRDQILSLREASTDREVSGR